MIICVSILCFKCPKLLKKQDERWPYSIPYCRSIEKKEIATLLCEKYPEALQIKDILGVPLSNLQLAWGLTIVTYLLDNRPEQLRVKDVSDYTPFDLAVKQKQFILSLTS